MNISVLMCQFMNVRPSHVKPIQILFCFLAKTPFPINPLVRFSSNTPKNYEDECTLPSRFRIKPQQINLIPHT